MIINKILLSCFLVLNLSGCYSEEFRLGKNGLGELRLGERKIDALNLVQNITKVTRYGEDNIEEFLADFGNQKIALRFENNLLYFIELKNIHTFTQDNIKLGSTLRALKTKCNNIKIGHGLEEGGYFTVNCRGVKYYFSPDQFTDKELESGTIDKNKEKELIISRIYVVKID